MKIYIDEPRPTSMRRLVISNGCARPYSTDSCSSRTSDVPASYLNNRRSRTYCGAFGPTGSAGTRGWDVLLLGILIRQHPVILWYACGLLLKLYQLNCPQYTCRQRNPGLPTSRHRILLVLA